MPLLVDDEYGDAQYEEGDFETWLPKIYETNKMRYWLKAVYYSSGMEAIEFQHAEFIGVGCVLMVPNTYQINAMMTDDMWRDYPDTKWKSVYIWKVGFTWKEFQDYSLLGAMGSVNGVIGALTSNLVQYDILKKQLESIKHYPVWENMMYKGTASNNILKANYLKVLKEIQPYILKKYNEKNGG